MTLELIEFQGH